LRFKSKTRMEPWALQQVLHLLREMLAALGPDVHFAAGDVQLVGVDTVVVEHIHQVVEHIRSLGAEARMPPVLVVDTHQVVAASVKR